MRTPMNATARNDTDANLAETAHHDSPRGVLRLGPEGIAPMPQTTEKAAAPRYTFASGSRPLDGFTIKRAIGRGGFGEVYYATSDAGKEVALKLITRNLEVERRGVVQCMNLKSPHLVAIHDLKQNDEGDTFVVMEFVSGLSLAQILAQHPAGLPSGEIRMWLKGLVEGVAYLHDHGIVHRDLKPANLFLEEGTVKIGDYGLAKALAAGSQNPGHSECVGTCHYMAPETSTGKYHKPIDVYAIGVILYEMVTGRVPFDGESVGEVLMKHLTSRPDLSILPEPFRGIVGRALAKDPNHRPQRVTDLLLPGDAPREPDLRFIGEKSSAISPTANDATGKREDVLRINDEEPVFFIGPDTRPAPVRPRPPGRNQWLWTNPVTRAVKAQRAALRTEATQSRPARVERPAPKPPQVARPAPPAVAAKPPLPPLGPPPALPSARVRLAELSSSMLKAAPIAALGSVLVLPLTNLASDSPRTDPRTMAVVFGTTLLATWTALIVGRVREGGKSRSRITRAALHLLLGAMVGIVGFGLAEATHVGPTSPPMMNPHDFTIVPTAYRSAAAGAVEFAAFFALAGLLAPAYSGAARNRKSRLSVMAIVWSALVGTVLCLMFPAVMPAGAIAVGVTALATQLVSPYSREASIYAREAARRAA